MNSKKIASISLSLLAGSHFIQAADNDRPNIIFIMSDDHTSQAISAYNGMLKDILPSPFGKLLCYKFYQHTIKSLYLDRTIQS